MRVYYSHVVCAVGSSYTVLEARALSVADTLGEEDTCTPVGVKVVILYLYLCMPFHHNEAVVVLVGHEDIMNNRNSYSGSSTVVVFHAVAS